MQKIHCLVQSSRTCTLLAVFWLFVAMSARAQNAPLGLQVALAKSNIIAGEPVVLHFKVTNLGSQPLSLKTGQQEPNWFRIQVRTESGELLPALSNHTVDHPGGFRGFRASPSLQPGESLEDSVIVTRYASIPQEGTYQVVFKSNLPYFAEGFGGQPAGALVAARIVPLRAAAPDATLLQKHAEHLLARIREFRQKGQPKLENLVIGSLFSMPEEVALPSWSAVLTDPNSRNGSLEGVRQLARLGTPAAADLLNRTAHDKHSDSNVRRNAWVSLQDVYKTSGPEMRGYVEQQFRDTYGTDSPLHHNIRNAEEAEHQARLRAKQAKTAPGS